MDIAKSQEVVATAAGGPGRCEVVENEAGSLMVTVFVYDPEGAGWSEVAKVDVDGDGETAAWVADRAAILV